jgi:hypothetical protein
MWLELLAELRPEFSSVIAVTESGLTTIMTALPEAP